MSDQSLPVEPARRGVAYARPWSLVAGLVLVALVFGLVLLRGQEPAPLPVDAPASEFSAGRAMALLGELLAEGRPHPVGSEMNARVRERIIGRLGALGYEVEVQETVVCRGWTGTQATCAPVQNVLTRLPGQVDGPAVMIMAHYDSVGAGPGAADDTHGVAVMLEIARIFRAIAVAEAQHEKRYLALAANIDNGQVFEKPEAVVWRCRNCGYLHEGPKAPKVCPACDHPLAHFEVLGENY